MKFGLMLIIIGSVFFLKNIGLLEESSWSLIWPLLIVLWGISSLGHHYTKTCYKCGFWNGRKCNDCTNGVCTSERCENGDCRNCGGKI